MELKEKEIEKVSSLEPIARYKYLLKKVADTELIYTLNNSNGNWATSTVKGYTLYPIWPAKEFALKCAVNEWKDFVVYEIHLNNFLNNLLPEIEKEGFLLNIIPVNDKTGFVVKSSEFIRDITEELDNYL